VTCLTVHRKTCYIGLSEVSAGTTLPEGLQTLTGFRTPYLLVVAMLTILAVTALTAVPPPIPRPDAQPAVELHTVLEKTIFKVDVLSLDLWLGPATARRIEPWLTRTPSASLADSLAHIALRSRDGWARLSFLRDVSLGRFLDGITANMRQAVSAGILTDEEYTTVAEGLPPSFAPLNDRGIKHGDRLFHRINGDTLRTVFQKRDGVVVIDQIDVGPERRLAVLGGFFAKGSDLRDGLLASLMRPARKNDEHD